MRWVRRWQYELRWEPNHRGVLTRDVETVTQLRAVVEWARVNPRVIKCTFRPVNYLEGMPATRCPDGHGLESPDPRQPYRLRRDTRRFACRSCPGHDVTVCPQCGALIIEPVPAYGCSAVMPDEQERSAESKR